MTITNNNLNDLSRLVSKGRIDFDVPLSPLTSIKIGGEAKVLVQTTVASELREVYLYCQDRGLRLFILGGGSNLLFSSRGFDGVILRMVGSEFAVEEKGKTVEVKFPAGYNSHLAAVKMTDLSLTGFEYMYGLPGSLGGAVYMNSKWPKDDFMTADVLTRVDYLDKKGNLSERDKEGLKFSYGYSVFQDEEGIILSATFKLDKGDREVGRKTCREVMDYRRRTQPTGVFTAGCVFKNISVEEKDRKGLPTTSAGYFIDKAGLKNYRHGRLLISPVHANFFINQGGATSDEYRGLVKTVQEKVRQKFDVELREEVLFVE